MSQNEATPVSLSTGEDAIEDSLADIVMALEMRQNNTIGCSYYIARDETLFFMEDIQLGNTELINQLKLFVSPSVVLLSSRALDETVKCFDPHFSTAGNDSMSHPFDLPFALELRPPSEFSYEAARTKLVNLQIGALGGPSVKFVVPSDETAAEPDEVGHQAKMMKLAALVSTEGQITVSFYMFYKA